MLIPMCGIYVVRLFLTTPPHVGLWQLALLTHEVSQAARRPNFARTLCLALEGRGPGRGGTSKLVEDSHYLANFSRTLKLPLQHQVDVAVALAHSETPGHASAGLKHVRAKLPELEAGAEAMSPESVFTLLHLLRTHADLAGPDTIAAIARAYPTAAASLAVLPLLDCDGAASMNLKPSERSAFGADGGLYDPCGLLRDLGYAATHRSSVLRAVLNEAGALPLTPSTAARLLLVRPKRAVLCVWDVFFCVNLLILDPPSIARAALRDDDEWAGARHVSGAGERDAARGRARGARGA